MALLDALSWLGLDWDEGPDVGGPHAPYRQSQRGDIYRDVVQRLLDAGEAYEAFSTPRRSRPAMSPRAEIPSSATTTSTATSPTSSARRSRRGPQAGAAAADARRATSPGTTWSAATITFAAGHVPDFALTRANGDPLYTLVNPVDDALMRITHVLRGEDLLSVDAAPDRAVRGADRHRRRASGVPEFAHLPSVLGDGNKKLSKRDPQSNLFLPPRARLHPRGAAELPGAARLGHRRRPRRVQPRRDGRRVRRRRRELRTPPASTRRRPTRSTPNTSGC